MLYNLLLSSGELHTPAAFWCRSSGVLLALTPTLLSSSTGLGVPEPRAERQTPKNPLLLLLSQVTQRRSHRGML